jgi:hypothetical protein
MEPTAFQGCGGEGGHPCRVPNSGDDFPPREAMPPSNGAWHGLIDC